MLARNTISNSIDGEIVMFKFVFLFFLIVFGQYSFAKELTIVNNGSSTGINSQLLQEYVKQFSEYKVNITSTNSNCALSKMLWENSQKQTLYVLTTNIDGSSDQNNSVCYVGIAKENLLFINYSAPIELCSVGTRTWKDLTAKNSSHIIGITSTTTNIPEQFLSKLASKYDIQLKLVRINNNSDFMTLAKAQELDFGFRTGLSGLEFFKDKCMWNVSQLDTNIIIPNVHELKKMYDNLYEESVILHKNLTTDEINEFRNKLQRSWLSKDSVALRTRRGYDDTRVKYETEEERSNLFDRFLTRLESK